ncbi:hypothetical protein BSK66_31670 [Paenibacillus odorifer]|uniref:replicative DNA helicase n=1 Tax=Paenibacillus TaxID=44249 RepID=UPI0003E218FF|nr:MULTISPECIES: DnaB-like helicase C-terminal domain-containing protein [Paenibacillus]ETT46230.1 Replicative DNA helicase [Paenibacillus sp. FSL H8-237]OME29371.1 hypothetical protein BSK63_21720 [Paenibacillus odorifer]OME46652.1 hypothetical protein BSK66_31670 [Paenibacillus odorifer]
MNLDAERALLGSLLKDHTLMDDCFLVPADFTEEEEDNRLLFKVLQYAKEHSDEAANPFDPVVLVSKWGARLQRIGGLTRLMALRDSVPSTDSFTYYQRAVRTDRIQQELAELGRQIATNGGGDIAELKAKMEQLEELQQGDSDGGLVHMATLLEGHEKVIAKRANSGGITGAKAASEDFTQLSKGHQIGDLEILAGRPSMGKTLYMANDVDAVTSSGWGDAVFSLEMGGMEIVEQIASCIGGIKRDRIASGQMSDNDWLRYGDALEIIAGRLLYIDDRSGATVEYIRRQVKSLKKKHPGKRWVIHIDFLQFIQTEKNFENTKERIGYITKYLKRMARQLQVCVVCLSAVGRSCEQRPDKRPLMSDLRDSGDIESDADVVTFIYRDDYYYPESPKKGFAEIIVAKGRKIGTGTFDMAFVPSISRFVNLDKDQKYKLAEKVREHEQQRKNRR